MKFYIMGGGDSDVGIPSSEAMVEFTSDDEWDDDLIQRTKELLKEWDDNGADILTEAEYQKQLDYENKMYEEWSK